LDLELRYNTNRNSTPKATGTAIVEFFMLMPASIMPVTIIEVRRKRKIVFIVLGFS